MIHISDTGLISRIRKGFLLINNKNTKSQIEKWEKKFGHFIKGIQTAKKHTEVRHH